MKYANFNDVVDSFELAATKERERVARLEAETAELRAKLQESYDAAHIGETLLKDCFERCATITADRDALLSAAKQMFDYDPDWGQLREALKGR